MMIRKVKKCIAAVVLITITLTAVVPVMAETTVAVQSEGNVINHGEAVLSPEKAEMIRNNYIAFANDPELLDEDIIINYYGTFSGYDAIVISITDEIIEPYGDYVSVYGYEFNFTWHGDCERFYVHKDGEFIPVKEAAAWNKEILSEKDVAELARNFPGALRTIDGKIYPVLHVSKEKKIKQAYIEYHMENSGYEAYKDYTIDDIMIRFYLGIIDGRDIVVVYDKAVADILEKYPQKTRIGGYIFDFPFDADQCIYAWEEGSMMKVGEAKRAGELSAQGIWRTGLLYGDVPHMHEIPYKDVDLKEWYANGMYETYAMKLMTGLSETTFGPYETVSRAQFITILYRLMPGGYLTAIRMPFTDVDKNSWYASAVKWGYASKIIFGYEDGRFGPDEDLTREQLATILYRFAESRRYDTTIYEELDRFGDSDDVSAYAYDAMRWCVANGIITGNDGNLKPQDTATRAECAVMIARYVEKFE